MRPSLSSQEFVTKWRKVELKERAGAQEHFLDLCALVGHPTPADDDPAGERFCFEAGASKARGGQGWADVWKRGFFAWEYKGKHKDLDPEQFPPPPRTLHQHDPTASRWHRL